MVFPYTSAQAGILLSKLYMYVYIDNISSNKFDITRPVYTSYLSSAIVNIPMC